MNPSKIFHASVVASLLLEAVTQYIYFPGKGIGATAQWKNGAATVAASSSPLSVTWSALGVLLFVVLIVGRQQVKISGIPAWWRRVLASCVDFYFFVLTVAPISALLDLELEARRTGHFAWHFDRAYVVETDVVVGVPMVLLCLALLFLYFVFPLTRGRQTVGCFVMKTKVTPPFGDQGLFTWRTAARRTWYEVQGICRLTLLLRPKRDAEGNTWYDIESDCRVVSVDYT
jgi:uncharacterized RDD family membrane protein YckC